MRSRVALVLALSAVPLGAGCGGCGDDGAGADAGGFVLVSRTPEADDGNVWVRAPIVLEFSHVLDPASVDDQSIALSVGEEAIAHDTAISDDGTTVTLVVSEPPPTPALVTIAVGTALQDDAGETFAGESWSFTLPVWQHPAAAGAIGDGRRPQLAVAGEAQVAAWIDADGQAVVRRLDGATWSDLGGGLGPAGDVRLASDGAAVAVAYSAAEGVTVQLWEGSEWQSLGTLAVTGIDAAPVFDVAIDGEGQPVVAMAATGGVQVARWDGQDLVSEPLLDAVPALTDLALAVDGSSAVVALISNAGVLRTFRQTDGGWEELTTGVDFNAAERPDVVAAGGVIAVSWQKDDAAELATRHAYAARWSGSTWLRFAHAADLDIQTDARATSIALDGEQATMAWFEGDRQSRKVYAARATIDEQNWTYLDSALNGIPAVDAVEPTLALSTQGDPIAAFAEEGQVVLARWNASPTLRRGLAERLSAGSCAISEDDPPATLAETGCYADVPGYRLSPELIPFEINSPLWSDGAHKRRFMFIPDGTSILYSAPGPLAMPVGTILVKEFWLERVPDDPTSRFPVETRFLVKRCEEGVCLEPWQGYSYLWNPEGTEADLRTPGTTDERIVWKLLNPGGEEIDHTHIYPSRLNCTRCHNAAAGRVLGLQAAQLNRPASYGGIVDNQLETLLAIGVLTGANSAADAARLPSSLDPSYDYEKRSRAYYHANCAQCHRPGGERPTIDFRFETPLAVDNICDRLTVGNGTGSTLYIRDATRGDGQMPPLATDLVDSYQLFTTDAWIDGMLSCP